MGVEKLIPSIMASEISSIQISPDPLPPKDYRDNETGLEREKRVAEIIGDLPQIQNVRITEKNGVEDQQMIDLFVSLSPHYEDIPFDSVHVQVKSRTKSISNFKRSSLRKQVLKEGEDSIEARQEWLRKNRLIIINGGFVNEYTRVGESEVKRKRPVTDNEILTSFTDQLNDIIVFSRSTHNQKK